MKGEFAFRFPNDDRYKLIKDVPEFNKNLKIDWCFIFDRYYSKRKIGVVIMKKESIWVDVDNWINIIDKSNKMVYGIIENFEVGSYKILITDNEKIIAEKKFLIYEDDQI